MGNTDLTIIGRAVHLQTGHCIGDGGTGIHHFRNLGILNRNTKQHAVAALWHAPAVAIAAPVGNRQLDGIAVFDLTTERIIVRASDVGIHINSAGRIASVQRNIQITADGSAGFEGKIKGLEIARVLLCQGSIHPVPCVVLVQCIHHCTVPHIVGCTQIGQIQLGMDGLFAVLYVKQIGQKTRALGKHSECVFRKRTAHIAGQHAQTQHHGQYSPEEVLHFLHTTILLFALVAGQYWYLLQQMYTMPIIVYCYFKGTQGMCQICNLPVTSANPYKSTLSAEHNILCP